MTALVPPHSLAAEQSVLGGVLLDNSAWPAVQAVLRFSDFYTKPHQVLFRALAAMLADGQAVDVLTVHEFLISKGHAETVGGLAYIGQLARDTPSVANIGSYAAIVKDKSIARQVLVQGRALMDQALAGALSARELVALVEQSAVDLGRQLSRGERGLVSCREVMGEVLERMEAAFDRDGQLAGAACGFKDLDQLTSGFGGGDLVVIAARPSMGKTAFVLNIAEHLAKSGQVVAFFSMEMQAWQIGQRLLSSVSHVSLKRVRESWRLGDDEWARITAGCQRVMDDPLYVDDTPGLTVSAVRSRCVQLMAELRESHPAGLGAICIDYLQLMGSDRDRGANRNAEIEDITRSLKRFAKELNIPILLLSQLNRELERRPNKRPVSADLRDSGSIEQDADVVLMLYRDEVYNEDTPDKDIAEVIVCKQRNGPLGTIRLAFDGEHTRFRDLAGDY